MIKWAQIEQSCCLSASCIVSQERTRTRTYIKWHYMNTVAFVESVFEASANEAICLIWIWLFQIMISLVQYLHCFKETKTFERKWQKNFMDDKIYCNPIICLWSRFVTIIKLILIFSLNIDCHIFSLMQTTQLKFKYKYFT